MEFLKVNRENDIVIAHILICYHERSKSGRWQMLQFAKIQRDIQKINQKYNKTTQNFFLRLRTFIKRTV